MSIAGLHVRDVGSGPPLLLVHGWSCPGAFFNGQVAALSPQARCLVPDLPGHGRTGTALPRSIEAAADALQALIVARGLEDVTLCGWSMGAHVAYALVARHGAMRLRQVVAIDMSPKVLNASDWSLGTRNGLDQDSNRLFLTGLRTSWPELPPRIARRLFAEGSKPDPELLRVAEAEIAAGDSALLAEMWASLTAQDFRELLKAFPVPLHLAAGAASQLYGPGIADWHRQHVPGCRVHTFAGSGHAPHLQEPDAFNRLLAELLTA